MMVGFHLGSKMGEKLISWGMYRWTGEVCTHW